MRYTEDELRSLFQHKFDRKVWTGFLQNFMEGARLRVVPEEFHTPSDNEKGFFLGEYNTSDHYKIGLFQFNVKAASVARKRVGLRNLVKSLINPNWGEFDAAFAVFASDSDWRLSFICDIKEEKTAPKRFTYVFGEKSLLYRTPVSRLSAIQGNVTFASLKEAFSVEKVSKDFFCEYREIYADFVQYLTGNRYVKKTQGSGYELKSFPGEPQNKAFYEALGKDDKRARDFVKKMMGRITFLYFLQQKGWMCGDKNYMLHLFESSSDKNYYLKKVLVPLFFGVLNTKPEERKAVFAKRKWNDELRKGWETIPYLNGGLFEPDEEDLVVDACSTHIFRQKDFEELFEFYSHYNFTIDENDPTDAEVGVDPEMLGKIFESLLEDNKDKGAFYTPKEIVQYMCQESLVAYLVTKTGIEEERLREFVKEPEDNKDGFTEDERYKILDGVLSVKICDPAIGSGAFPIGLLNELVRCKEAIYGDKKGRADIKREIIRDNIYGVDIEKGAVDIARLRFWLSLVVDEDTPSPLPNLDYKIMQGNSLLEWYDDVDLSKLSDISAYGDLFGGVRAEELKKNLTKLLKHFFSESDHDKKHVLKEAIKATITDILDIAGVEIPAGIDLAENSQFFLWHTWYNEVFVNNGGFDICLGNPPYFVYEGNNKGELPRLRKIEEYSISFGGKLNAYKLFLANALRFLVKKDGINCFIFQNSFMADQQAANLRNYVLNNCQILTIDSFPERDNKKKRVFENVKMSVCILLLRNSDTHNRFLVNIWDDKYKSSGISTYFTKAEIEAIDPIYITIPRLREEAKPIVLKMIERRAIAIKCQEGELNVTSHRSFFSADPSLPVIMKGAGIQKYYYTFKMSQGEIEHLREEEYLKKFGKSEKSHHHEIERIVMQGMTGANDKVRLIMSIVPKGMYLGHSCKYILPSNALSNKCLLGFMNSKLANFFFRCFSTNSNVNGYEVESIPICNIPQNIVKQIENLVSTIMYAKAKDYSSDTLNEETAIDFLVYHLYSLSYEEVLIIDPETPIMREEYESIL